ncbi:MAG TPA: hypothetical protein DEF34_00160 [Desulfotomaculum sp.]|nr:MAG: hypothetical protein VR67_05535 [Peptococcaceae bacterium BRH_c8a]KJS79182.1 MAG: hypothetical protein JL56_00355 [Desulfotomaculum sp. BICA1-6]HBX22038.1 hypothetical protein [Desulfotomaculum sp.]
MIKTMDLRSDKPGLQIRILATRTTDGVVMQLLGGDKPHIGATVISHPRPSLTGGSGISCNSIVIPELGHKEDQLAKPLAEKIATTLNCTVVLVAGIHVDQASAEEIENIIKTCTHLVDKFIYLHLNPATPTA